MHRFARLAIVIACVPLVGCAVGPRYRRPEVETPVATRGEHGPADEASLADLPWWAVFSDPALQVLIADAIAGSHDLAAAAARVEEARNRIAVARADLLP